jgi:N-acetylmuramoyl-L-alanine amidase
MRRLGALLLLCSLAGAAVPAHADNFTAHDIRVLALNMYHEARGEGALGMLAVGWVVLNRVADRSYPDTVPDVVYQGCQFSWVCDDIPDRPRDPRSWRRALELAYHLIRRPTVDPTRGAMWYHASWVRDPKLGDRVAEVARIGRHVFYTLADRLPPRPGIARPMLLASR